jgi:hypothetical protein
MISKVIKFFSGVFMLLAFCQVAVAQETELSKAGIYLIPYPKEVKLQGADFVFGKTVTITLDKNATENDEFAVAQLAKYLGEELKIKTTIQDVVTTGKSIVLTRKEGDKKLDEQGYHLTVDADRVTVRARGEAGLFYGVQTILQLIRKNEAGAYVNGLEMTDWPDTKIRAAHYDTKHHQDTRAYVESFIRDLSRYKINMLIWEWEDKFAYPSHPEIGAPGTFTMKEMQGLTHYAEKYHIQIVPLVQGLGHASYILKWPKYTYLREVPASNFEFCPLKEDSYKLLFDLWDDAVKATPGSEYIHIGSDETYELGLCPLCKKKVEEIGKVGLYHLFTAKAAKHLQAEGRKVMVWEPPTGWAKDGKTINNFSAPPKGIILTESYDDTPDRTYAKEAKSDGYHVFAYDPNPGVEPLFLPYFFRKPRDFATDTIIGSLRNSYNYLASHLGKDVYDGVICTSWDDAGLHNQVWMLRFVTTAAYSWNATKPALPEFTNTFFKNYYGENEKDLGRLFFLLNEGAYFYMESFERNVWHDKSIGKTHLPDLPRGDAMEYNPYWNVEYADRIRKAKDILVAMNEATNICKINLERKIKNYYDIEVFKSLIELIKHTALTYLGLSAFENAIAEAHRHHILNHREAYLNLEKAEKIIQGQLASRKIVLTRLVTVWEKTRLPKGMSTKEKKYFFEQDRTVHFANRAPDMTYLIIDEKNLDLEGFLAKLQGYITFYHARFLNGK